MCILLMFNYNLYFVSKIETKENFLVFMSSFRNPNDMLYQSMCPATFSSRGLSTCPFILLSTLKVKHKRTGDTQSLALRDC